MALTWICLSNVTAHVPDPERSVPLEFHPDTGAVIQGGVAARPVPPWTPFQVDSDEAGRILARHNGVRIPDDVVDRLAWVQAHARSLGITPPSTPGGRLP